LLRALAVTQSEHGTQLRKLATEQTRLAGEQSRMAGEQSRMAGEQSRTTSTIERLEAGVRTIIELLGRGG